MSTDEVGHDSTPPRRRRLPTFDLSATQLIATGLAAITATFAASFLGVAGTVVGAALFSVLTAVGNAVYGQSLRRTRERVRDAVPVLTPRPVRTQVFPVATEPSVAAPVLPTARPVRAVIWKRMAFGTVSIFVVVLAVVTGVEVVAGRPLSDVVRGSSGAGTSFFGDSQVVTRTRTVGPTTPTVTLTVTPKVEITTPTVTRTAPAATRTTTPTATATASPTDTATGTGAATGTGTGTSSASTSGSASASATNTP